MTKTNLIHDSVHSPFARDMDPFRLLQEQSLIHSDPSVCVILPTLSGCTSKDTAATPPTEPTEISEAEPPADDREEEIPSEEIGEETTNPEVPGEPEKTTEISGLIILTANYGTTARFTITSFDYETGEQSPISAFAIPNTYDAGYLYLALTDSFGTHRERFSYDFTKLAATEQASSNMESHAGWFDEDGNFYDVTEALGLQSKSDFDDPVQYQAIGFTEDDLFVYYDRNHETSLSGYYAVPISNLTPEAVSEGNPLASGPAYDEYGNFLDINRYCATEWISETSCIVNVISSNQEATESVILDVTDKSTTEYIPGDSRKNWNGVLSPDGTMVAFMSVPKYGNEAADIFVMPIDGGDPVRVAAHDFTFADPRESITGKSYDTNFNLLDCSILIDWR